jgi:hypothetical protein
VLQGETVIETLDDIIEELANRIGIYGAHGLGCEAGSTCRMCWTSGLRSRINAAVEIERKLKLADLF